MHYKIANTSTPKNDGTRVNFIRFSNGDEACYVDGKLLPSFYAEGDLTWMLNALGVKHTTHLALPTGAPLPENFSELKLKVWEPSDLAGAFGS